MKQDRPKPHPRSTLEDYASGLKDGAEEGRRRVEAALRTRINELNVMCAEEVICGHADLAIQAAAGAAHLSMFGAKTFG